MSKEEFLSQLKSKLEGRVDRYELDNQMKYYSEYISSEAVGKTEEEVIESIGDPRLIAKTIISTYELSRDPMKKMNAHSYQEEQESEFQDSGTWKVEFGTRKKMKWYNKVLLISGIAIVLLFIISLLFSVISFFFAFVLPILLVVVVIKVFLDFFRNRP